MFFLTLNNNRNPLFFFKSTRTRSRLLFLFIAFFHCFFLPFSYSQKTDFAITSIEVNDEHDLIYIDLHVVNEQGTGIRRRTDLRVDETAFGETYPLEIAQIKPLGKETKDQSFSILFLLDISGSMKSEDRLIKAKEAIIETIKHQEKTQLVPCNFFLSTFDNNISPIEPIDGENVKSVLNKYNYGSNTDLYRALYEKSREFRKFPGKQVIILLSDGENDTRNNPYYRTHNKITPEEVFSSLRLLSAKMTIWTVGLGNNADFDFLEEVVNTTPNKRDRHIHSDDAHELRDIFKKLISASSSNYQVSLFPSKNSIYQAEERFLSVEWIKPKIIRERSYQAGSPINPIDIGIERRSQAEEWIIGIMLGLVFVMGLLGILIYGTPWIRRQKFRLKYVQNYIPEEGITKKDPITTLPFKAGDKVVVKCQQTVSMNTWEKLGHCPNYPNCLEYARPCDGAGAPPLEEGGFWEQKGIYKKLNWLWFGTLGGYIAWLLFAFTQNTFVKKFGILLENFFYSESISKMLEKNPNFESLFTNIDVLCDDILTGICIGAGLCLTLSWASEKSDGRNISWIIIITRSIVGSAFSFVIFSSCFLLQYLVIGHPYLSGILTWLLFGVMIGFVLSVKSSIEWKRGIIAGSIASFFAYQIYALVGFLFTDFEIAKLFGFLFLGGMLGYIIVSVITILEDYELHIVSPKRLQGTTFSIGKWLRQGDFITIGTSHKCTITIKWKDEIAQPEHAKIGLRNGIVYIEPFEDTYVDGSVNPISYKNGTPLNNGNTIQFGTGSISVLKFVAKEADNRDLELGLIGRLLNSFKKRK